MVFIILELNQIHANDAKYTSSNASQKSSIQIQSDDQGRIFKLYRFRYATPISSELKTLIKSHNALRSIALQSAKCISEFNGDSYTKKLSI